MKNKELNHMKNKMSNENQLKVFISNRESRCDECGEDLGRRECQTRGNKL